MGLDTLATDPRRITADEAQKHVTDGDAVLIDTRHPAEHAYEHIVGAHLMPESDLHGEKLRELADGKPIILYCRTSRRTAATVDQLMSEGYGEVVHIDGGLEAWKRSGHETISSPGAPRFSIIQQVQMTAGTMVLIGTLLGAFVDPAWLVLPVAAGAGIAFAGFTGLCFMANALERMPWNKLSATDCHSCE